MIGFGLMLALAGIILLMIGAAQAAQNRSYANCSETITGTIIHKRRHKHKNYTSYELTTSYMVDGTTYEKVVGSSLTEYQTLQEGDQLELLYKPDNPKRAVRPMGLNPRNVRIPLIFGAALIVAGIVLLFIGKT